MPVCNNALKVKKLVVGAFVGDDVKIVGEFDNPGKGAVAMMAAVVAHVL